MKQLAIYGCGGHGRVVADVAELSGWDPVFFDDGFSANGGRLAVNGEQWAVDGGQRTVDGGQWTVGRGRWAEDGGRLTVNGGQWAVHGVPWKTEGNMEMLLAGLDEFDACVVAIGNNAVRREKEFRDLMSEIGASKNGKQHAD